MLVELLLMASLSSSDHGHHEGHQRDSDGAGKSAVTSEKGGRFSWKDNDESAAPTVSKAQDQAIPIAGAPPPKVALSKAEAEALSSKRDSRHVVGDTTRTSAQSIPSFPAPRGVDDAACADSKVDSTGRYPSPAGEPCQDLSASSPKHRP
jgi:hypothetical protein